MNAPYTSDRLKVLFQTSYNPSEWQLCLQRLFHTDELRAVPETLNCEQDKGEYLGAINTTDHYRIGLFHYEISHGSVVKKRVGLRNLVRSFINPRWGEFDAALVVFESGAHWRLSFICDIRGEATSPKRFTYVFGSRDLLYRTPIERFTKLQQEGITFAKLREAFSVEALSDEFFNRYREQYADFVQYITGKRYVKSGSKWEERVVGRPHATLMQAFGGDDKRVRDYVKKMMGRLTFLHFLQRKGWMCGDLNYLQHLFLQSAHQDDYLDSVLEPLFFGILNTKPAEREALFTSQGWDMELLEEWKEIPYLNGGLFECDDEDATQCRFPARYFRDLFQFFSEYNFTIDENDPTDAEIGVDPEMLGKIFENLLEDNKDKGAFYTPKEIVRYMCQESLIAYLVTQSIERGNTNPREKVERAIRDLLNRPEEIVPRMNERQKTEFGESLYRIKICDPAIGSGAFPMGILNELVRLRASIGAWAKDDTGKPLVDDYAALKSEIICHNIYGVDIEHGAIDIARLRFWLSIVVDEQEPHTLPNLDYKFMQGNSLITTFNGEYINLDTNEQGHANVVEMKSEKKRLYQLKQQYYTATGEQKHKLNIAIKDSILSLISLQLDFEYRHWFDQHNTTGYLPGLGIPQQLSFADIKQKLPADKQRMCDIGSSLRKRLWNESLSLSKRAKTDIRFFDWRMMFTEVFEGENPGFDIVIGNPPYITYRGKDKNSISNRELDILIANYIHSAEYKVNSYALFIEAGIKLCNTQGTLSYIIPSTILQNDYLKKIREFLICRNQINEIVSFSNKVFDAITDSIILRCKKGYIKNNTMLFKRVADLSLCPIEQKEYVTDKWNNKDNLYVIDLKTNSIDSVIFSKMETSGLKLDEYYKVYVGIVAKGIKQFLSNTKDTIYYKKYLQGKHIAPYQINYKSVYINFIPELLHSNTDQFVYEQEEKILVRKTGNTLIASLDTEQFYTDQSLYNLYLKPNKCYSNKTLLAILNSRLLNYYYNKKLITNADVFPYIKGVHLKMFPLPLPNKTIEQELSILVNQIINNKKQNIDTSDIENLVNNIVYQLYGLTNTEIKYVEENI